MDAPLLLAFLAAGLAGLLRWLAAARTRRRLRRRLLLPFGPPPAKPAFAPWRGDVPLWVWYRANRGSEGSHPLPWRPRPRAHA